MGMRMNTPQRRVQNINDSYSTLKLNQDIKRDFPQHLKTNDIEQSHTISGIVMSDRRKGPSLTPSYTSKINEAWRSCEQTRLRNKKEVKVSQQAQLGWSPANRKISASFVLI